MKTAFIFAAGRGERLKPMTQNIPKALCPINGVPLIEYHVTNLKKAGFERILINHAYLGDQIKRRLGNGTRFNLDIIYLPEPPGALETAGAIVNARAHINQEPFITINADIYTNFDYAHLRSHHLTHLAHLILVPKQESHPKGDFGLSAEKFVMNTPRIYTFSGITCYNPEPFMHYATGRFSVTPLLREWAQNNQVTGELYEGIWFDIGTPSRLELIRKKAAELNWSL